MPKQTGMFYANYRKTPRNAASGQVFADLGLEEIEEPRWSSVAEIRANNRAFPEDGVIDIAVHDGMMVTTA